MNVEERERTVNSSWNKLYQRLEQDGLLTVERAESKLSIPKIHYTRWAAIIILLLVGLSTAYIWRSNMASGVSEKMVLHNAMGQPTLITTLEDGSTIYLNEETSIEYPASFAENKREISLSGNAFFEVTGNKKRPFVIQTTSATIEVLGTSFNVRSKEEESFSLSVNSGEVKVTSKQNMKSVYVKAGETAFFSVEGLKTVQTTDFEPLADYLRYVHFKDQNIANIVRIVNQRMSGLNLNIDPKVGDRFLTITLSNESPEEIARLICLALKLTYINKEEGIYITLPE